MSEEKIVMFDSQEAAKQVTVTLWQSRDGRLYSDERIARYDGCTHQPCKDCGEATGKWHIYCPDCEEKRDVEKWKAMPRVKYEGGMLYSQTREKYYNDIGEVKDDLQDAIDYGGFEKDSTIDDLRLVVCEPNYARQLDANDFDLPEDGELSESLNAAVTEFNAKAAKEIVSWSPGKNVPIFEED